MVYWGKYNFQYEKLAEQKWSLVEGYVFENAKKTVLQHYLGTRTIFIGEK